MPRPRPRRGEAHLHASRSAVTWQHRGDSGQADALRQPAAPLHPALIAAVAVAHPAGPCLRPAQRLRQPALSPTQHGEALATLSGSSPEVAKNAPNRFGTRGHTQIGLAVSAGTLASPCCSASSTIRAPIFRDDVEILVQVSDEMPERNPSRQRRRVTLLLGSLSPCLIFPSRVTRSSSVSHRASPRAAMCGAAFRKAVIADAMHTLSRAARSSAVAVIDSGAICKTQFDKHVKRRYTVRCDPPGHSRAVH
jgi:hypothetical protein